MSKRPDLTEQLRRAIAESELSDYRIAQDTGIPQPSLNRFRNRLSSLSLPHAGTLARFLGLELRPVR